MNTPNKEYEVIYADPPWRYDFQESESRMIENHYPTMGLAEIKSLDVPAAPDSVLFMWATSPKLKGALDVMNSWGFEYRTNAAWDKQKIAQGYWFRGQHELLLVGKRGDVSPPDPTDRRSSVFNEQATEHSKKPRKVIGWINKAFPDKSKVELFARDGMVGWDVWGNEAPDTKQATITS